MVEVNEARRGDSARAAIELIEKAMEGVTPGPWHDAPGTTTGRIVVAPNMTKAKRRVAALGGPDREANAAYIAACSPDHMREVLAAAREAEELKREIAELKADLAELRAFAASFKLTCVESSFYKDCYIHINEPDAVSFRLGNGSQFSKFIAKLEDRRARALLGGENAGN